MEQYLQIPSLKMSSITECQQQVHLVNIMSVAEDRLQTNFRVIMKRLQQHDRLVFQQTKRMDIFEEKNEVYKNHKEKKDEEKLNSLIQKVYLDLNSQKNVFEEYTSKNSSTLEQTIKNIQSDFQKRQSDIVLQIDEMRSRFENHFEKLENQLQSVQKHLYKAYEEIYKKEDVIQSRKISKEIDTVKEKNTKFETDSRVLEYKIEKMQILSEKAEKNQAKREGQLLREIEEKVKKQVKNMQRGVKFSVQQINSRENIPEEIGLNMTGRSVHYHHHHQQIGSDDENEQAVFTQKANLQKMVLNKLADKISLLENKLSHMEINLKQITENKKTKKHNEVDEKIKEKLNQLKPEIVKLWAKCDALDDRIVFSDRRSEERSRLVNNIVDSHKQNNWGKMDEKLKVFQTEMFAALKQIKSKIQLKLNSVDYEKYCGVLEERIKQIMQIIYLKSDKMEVKKALLFLEAKIKQIILVISEDQQHQKDALLTKKQLKCMSCDKDVEKLIKLPSSQRGNWDGLPIKEHSPERLGKFGMTNYGLLSKKLKKLESKDFPVLSKKKNAQSQKQNI